MAKKPAQSPVEAALAAAHLSESRAGYRISVMLARRKVNRLHLVEAVELLKFATNAIEGLIAALPAPSNEGRLSSGDVSNEN